MIMFEELHSSDVATCASEFELELTTCQPQTFAMVSIHNIIIGMKEPPDDQHPGTNKILILLFDTNQILISFDEYHKMKESLYNRVIICINTILIPF